MRKGLLRVALLGLLAATAAGVRAQSGDERILAAREALRTGKHVQLAELARSSEDHPLDAYVAYWRLGTLLARSEPLPEGLIEEFLRRHEGSLLAEQLREAWIRRMVRHGEWAGVAEVYAALRSPSRDITCHFLNARLVGGDRQALSDAMKVWDYDGPLIEACQPVMTALVIEGRVSSEDIWWRLRRAVEDRRPAVARLMAGWLPSAQAPAAKDLDRIFDNPRAYLDRLPLNFSISRRGRELALAALVRMTGQDAADAHARLQRHFDRFQGDERAWVYANLGWRGAEQHLPEALEWYRAAGEVAMSSEQHAWHVRAALRAERWKEVQRAIELMPEAQAGQPAWVYWQGRALRAAGDDAGALYQFARIADGIDFYGLLAAEELGRRFEAKGAAAIDREDARRRAAADPGLQRALALFRLDLRTEAIREWNWALRERDDAFVLAAAEIAARQNLYDRAINTAEMARNTPDLGLRFLAPYRELIEPQARAQGLDMAWVYGLMRQESRFVPAARSSAGAQGLMQVMPATGRWVARKAGIDGYSLAWLREPENNVMIGTRYMKIVMDDLDNHPVLASAGYNAGPGRARRWRDGRPLEGAIYAETIPFDETRDYVKKVMANAVVYGALFEGKPQSLKSRLSTVGAAQ